MGWGLDLGGCLAAAAARTRAEREDGMRGRRGSPRASLERRRVWTGLTGKGLESLVEEGSGGLPLDSDRRVGGKTKPGDPQLGGLLMEERWGFGELGKGCGKCTGRDSQAHGDPNSSALSPGAGQGPLGQRAREDVGSLKALGRPCTLGDRDLGTETLKEKLVSENSTLRLVLVLLEGPECTA